MIRKIYLAAAVAACGLVVTSQMVQSAPLVASGTQTFTVNVPKKVSITPPVAVSKIYDPDSLLPAESSPSFPTQVWDVKGNVRSGVTVSFAAPYFSSSVGAFKANTGLAISLPVGSTQGPGTWTVNTASHSTDYANVVPVNTATVAAESDGVGRANFNLVVTFVPVDYTLLGEGAYVTTVTGTVTEK